MNYFTELLLTAAAAALVNNVVLSRFLGLCPFLGVSKKTETALGMGAAVLFVMTIASAATWVIDKMILRTVSLTYLRTIVFIIVIAALVQIVEMILKKKIPSLYSSLGVYLPLITTNCAVLGIAIDNVQKDLGFAVSMASSIGTSVGFGVAVVLMAGIRERIDGNNVPDSFKGMPIVLITAGLMAIAFMGFQGVL